MISLKLRSKDGKEAGELLGLIHSIFPQANVRLGKDDRLIVAEYYGTAAAFVHFFENRKNIIIRGIGVKEKLRNRGIGSKLMQRVIKHAEKKGKCVYLKAKIFNEAVFFYERQGFAASKFGRILTLVRRPPN